MRLVTSFLLLPLAACSMAVTSGNQAQPGNVAANMAAPAPAPAPDAAHAPVNGLIPAPEGKDAPPGNGAQPRGDGTGGRELSEGSANLDFIAVNRTGRTIRTLAISPAGEDSWSDNLIREPLSDGERGAAGYTRDYEVCAWDVRVTYEGGGQRDWPGINLCDTVRVELR